MTISADSRRLRTLARRLVESCPPHLASEIAVTGSASRGVSDKHSDLDLMLCAETLPSLEQCRRWVAGMANDGYTLESFDAIVWFFGSTGEQVVEIVWQTTQSVDRLLTDIVAGDILDHRRLRTAEAVANAVVLETEGQFETWKQTLAVYPGDLRCRLIVHAASHWELSAKHGAALRGDRLAFVAEILEDLHRALRILCAINQRWEPSWTWTAALADGLDIKPPRLAERIDEILLNPDAMSAKRCALTLAADVLALTPEPIDVQHARRTLAARTAS